MKTTVIFNAKGGVGKTVTTVNMAADLAARGKRVVVIDADPQCNLSTFFGAETDANTVYDVLMGTAEPYYPECLQTVNAGAQMLVQPGSPELVELRTGTPTIRILPGSPELVLADIAALRDGRARLGGLRDFVRAMAEDDDCDFVLIDCPPSFTAATSAALVAADDVVIPIKLDAFSVDGMGELSMQIRGMRQFNPRLRVSGALITMRDANTVVAREVERALRESAVPVYSATIRRAEAVNASTFQRLPLLECNGRAARAAAADYHAFVDEYLRGGAGRDE